MLFHMTLMTKPDYIESMAGGIAQVMMGLHILAAAALGTEGSGNQSSAGYGIGDQISGFVFKRAVFPNSLFISGDLFRMRSSPPGCTKPGFLSGPGVIFPHRLLGVILVLVLPLLLVLLNEFGMRRHPSPVVLYGLLLMSIVILPLLLKAFLFIGEIPLACTLLGPRFLEERIDFSHFRTLQKESKMSTVIWGEPL